MIPHNITKQSVINAIKQIDEEGVPKGHESTKYNLIYNEKLYPPKYTLALANLIENSEVLKSDQFNGGKETNSFLQKLGFEIVGEILWDADNYIKLGDYEDVSEDSVKEISRVLKQQNLNKKISIEYDDIDLKINFNSVSKYCPSQKVRRFDMDDDIHAVRYEGKQIFLYMYMGEWSTNARIKNSHISIYTNSSEIGGERFFQIELSDCLEDDNYIYILKKISKNTGSGAIYRLNNSSYPTKEREKRYKDLRERRKELVRRTYSDVIKHNNDDWICIYKFDKEKLFDSFYHKELFNECIEKIIEFTFAMESIVVEVKKFGEFRQTTQKVDKLSNEALLSRIKKINKIPNKIETTQTSYVRNECITEYAKRRANGVCQLCREEAPFIDKKGRPYLEVHHITPLSEGGEDSIENTVALCPNCHRKMHSLGDTEDIKYLNTIFNKEDLCGRK